METTWKYCAKDGLSSTEYLLFINTFSCTDGGDSREDNSANPITKYSSSTSDHGGRYQHLVHTKHFFFLFDIYILLNKLLLYNNLSSSG